jgi:hypothetical protein
VQSKQQVDVNSLIHSFGKEFAIHGERNESPGDAALARKYPSEFAVDSDWTMVDSVFSWPTKSAHTESLLASSPITAGLPTSCSASSKPMAVLQDLPRPSRTTSLPYNTNPFRNRGGSPSQSLRSKGPGYLAGSCGSPSTSVSTGLSSRNLSSRPVSGGTSAASISANISTWDSFSSSGGLGQTYLSVSGQKSKARRDDGNDDEDDEENRNQHRPIKRVKHNSEQKKLMCPYFKRHPLNRGEASCSHEYETVHRIK